MAARNTLLVIVPASRYAVVDAGGTSSTIVGRNRDPSDRQ